MGIGLAITFFGLIAALTIATEGIDANLEQSIEELLMTASAKFYTSLLALFHQYSTVYIRFISSQKDHMFKNVCDKIEALVSFVTSEKIALEQLEEL